MTLRAGIITVSTKGAAVLTLPSRWERARPKRLRYLRKLEMAREQLARMR